MINLTYTYASLSNKLAKVTDNGALGANNGALGDFKDGANGGDDYVYDDNGNLIVDLNKNALNATGGKSTPLGTSGIIYNYLDKPETINITGKGTIKILYDADGNKLQRTFTPASGIAKVTTYINEFVYQGDAVAYINFEEGRIRILNAVSQNNGYDGLAIDGPIDLPSSSPPSGVRGAFDFFIRDYQQNVRMILTEETHYGINQATMESARAASEEPYFGQQGANNEVAQTRTDKPPGWTSNTSNKVSKLGALTHKAGPNVLLKVMAGDQITASANYYYQNPVTNGTGNNLIGPIITALVQSILGSPATGLAKGNTTSISNNLNADAGFISKTAPDANNPNGNLPKAYLTIIFFNERFKYVSEGSTALRVMQAGNGADPLVLSNIKAPKNGFAYVYLSNESNEPVYFDDFKVADTRGRIIEEDHYYAFGLKIAGISSVKMGDPNEGMLANKNLYNDKELFDDVDLNWYDYGFRNYDPQIGRFPQLDPLTDDYPYYTPYQFTGNEPIANVDLDGLEQYQTLAPVVLQGLPAAPAAVNTGVNIFKLSASLIPTVSNIAQVHSEQSSVSRQLQATTQYQTSILNSEIKPKPQGEIREWNPLSRYSDFELGMIRNNIATDASIALIAPQLVFGEGALQFGIGYHYGNTDLMINGGANMIAGAGSGSLKYIKSLAKTGLQLENSIAKVMGDTYKALGEVTVPIKNTELLTKLKASSKGDWVKVYEAGLQNGNKIETHYFRNNTTRQIFDVKIKYNYWHQKAFKNIGR